MMGAAVAMGQGPSPGREPHLPGAVTKAPPWIGQAPFDVAKFFVLPPSSQNAAPLYLDAFFEFGEEMAVCFPPDQRGRAKAAKANGERIDSAYTTWDRDRDPAHLDRAAIDALLTAMQPALRKLDLAQARPRCAFAEGMTYDVTLPHTQVSRRAVRLWLLRAIRTLDRGEIEPAIGDIQRILRLGRDMRPRGAAIDQLVAAAFDMVACNILVPAILQHPATQVTHCDQLNALLRQHQAQMVDSFATGIEANYLMVRILIRAFEQGIVLTTDANGRAVEKPLDRDGRVRYFIKLYDSVTKPSDPSKRLDPRKLQDPQVLAKAAAQLDSLKLNFPRERQAIDDWAKTMLALRTAPYPDRIRGAEAVLQRYVAPRGGDPSESASLFLMTNPDSRSLLHVSVNDPLYIGAAECLIALKRWEILRQGRLVSLSAVCRAANLPGVPIDGYSGAPLRLAMVSGDPVIYSVGPDGDDDGGLKDADLGRNPDGDFLFRFPKSANSMNR
jgi:hypothetical protein